MSASAALLAGRIAAEQLMVDTCTVKRETGTVTNPDTGVITPTYLTVYTGKCRVQTRGFWGQRVDLGQAGVVDLRVELQLPMSATGLEINDEATVDTCVFDPDLVGHTFILRDMNRKTHATARRLMVEEIAG